MSDQKIQDAQNFGNKKLFIWRFFRQVLSKYVKRDLETNIYYKSQPTCISRIVVVAFILF